MKLQKFYLKKLDLEKLNIEIFKQYKLENIKEAHIDLENRKILGPAIIIP